jgi:hypothetical protein
VPGVDFVEEEMTDLNAMWAALEKYQPYADADGHGETWRRMCSERTEKAAEAATDAAWETLGGWADAAEAADSAGNAERADWLEWAKDVLYWSDRTIERIETAIKERESVLSNIEPVSNDDGQAQKMDAPEPLIHKHEWFRTGAMEYGVCRCIHCGAWNHEVESLKRQPLTDEEIDALELPESGTGTIRDLVRVVEKAHGVAELEAATELRRLHGEIDLLKVERNFARLAGQRLQAQVEAERDALKADAERYRYLRIHCYRYKWPNNEHDRAMHLSFTVSGIWANNHDPEVLDGCIDTAREVKP